MRLYSKAICGGARPGAFCISNNKGLNWHKIVTFYNIKYSGYIVKY
jgi:hypothetical protein